MSLGSAVTSSSTIMKRVEASPFFRLVLPAFQRVASLPRNLRGAGIVSKIELNYAFYIGYDVDDPIYDAQGAIEDFLDEFDRRLADGPMELARRVRRPRLVQHAGASGAPSAVISELSRIACKEIQNERLYLFQMNDDSEPLLPLFFESMVLALQEQGVSFLEQGGDAHMSAHPFIDKLCEVACPLVRSRFTCPFNLSSRILASSVPPTQTTPAEFSPMRW